jgi:hypothetical protein
MEVENKKQTENLFLIGSTQMLSFLWGGGQELMVSHFLDLKEIYIYINLYT